MIKKRKEMKEHQFYIPKEECVNLPHYWNEENLSAISLARLAEAGRTFDFLLDKTEDIYNIVKIKIND